ncbi:MAG: VWA domain-containing protein [Nitrospira sp.]|nr:VWA domain-containing protein [Nitrospira sp.]
MIDSKPCDSHSPLQNQRGSYLMISVIALMVLFGFAGLGIEVGRWYAVQGEMAKSIDGAAFAGAKNVNNPNLQDLNGFVLEVAQANFEAGLLGTDTPVFTVTNDGNGKITVDGSAHALNTLIKGFNPAYDKTQVSTSGSAKLRNAEIALVLDISGSMAGNALTNLKDGAEQFVENFEDHETTSKFALITFASGVMKPFDLNHNYVSPIESAINGLNAVGGTNAEDALAQAGALPWADQSALPPNERGKQVVVFFSDGNPTAFRGQFKYNGTDYDGVAAVHTGDDVYQWLLKPNKQSETFSIDQVDRTGDGKSTSTTACPYKNSSKKNVRWYIFDDPTYGLDNFSATSGIDPLECYINHPDPLFDYHAWLNKKMALDNAQALKDQGIEIYTIGLGNVDQNYLEQLSSGNGFSYYTTDPNELAGIFQQIANILKLVLVS